MTARRATMPLRRVPGFPVPAQLQRLVAELESVPHDATTPPVLANVAAPQRLGLGPCREVDLGVYKPPSFVLSQCRRHNEGYVYVCGMRSRLRHEPAWPRLPSGRMRLVALHRWILMATQGPPTSKQLVATHICGNDKCVLAAHLRWGTRRENKEDERFHREHNKQGKDGTVWRKARPVPGVSTRARVGAGGTLGRR